MRHLLMDPAFPDIVGEWAEEQAPVKSDRWNSANDNDDGEEEFADPLFALVARAEVEATRLW